MKIIVTEKSDISNLLEEIKESTFSDNLSFQATISLVKQFYDKLKALEKIGASARFEKTFPIKSGKITIIGCLSKNLSFFERMRLLIKGL